MSFTAIVPVRKGSRRLKNKNILPFANSTLLEYKIDQLKRVSEIEKIVVSSNCDIMLEMAERQGVLTHRREDKYCDEISEPFGEVVAHVCSNVVGENILWATCTSPLVEPLHYSTAITLYKEKLSQGFDSLMSVEEIKRYLWDESGPINYKLGIAHVPSQDLPALYRITDGILIAPRLKMIEWKYFHGKNPFKFVMDKVSSIDIDDIVDFDVAQCLYSKFLTEN
jgi:N-acylneuraminate cytidylyltransferase